MNQDRRKFLLALTAGLGGALGMLIARRNGIVLGSDLGNKTYLPVISKQIGSKVVHVHDSRVTTWTPSSNANYWDYVNQDIVNQMVDNGLLRTTGAASVAQAWSSLLPGYAAGKKIAIKASFNNAFVCGENAGAINGLIQIVNALVRGMKQAGVQESDVWVFDAIRMLPEYFISGSLYSGVKFFDNGQSCGNLHQQAGFDSPSSNAFVSFQSAANVQPSYIKVTNVLVNASYLINMPVMKIHGGGISLGFKNHYGSINDPALLHPKTFVTSASFQRDYSPLVDLFKNANIGPKTILTVGDGLFSSNYYTAPPVTWSIFGNAVPKSLFFSRDPVAVDCVMADYLRAEWPDKVLDQCYDYLRLANAAGLGSFEKGNPLSQGYAAILYDRYNQG
jgi:hypothetical protein